MDRTRVVTKSPLYTPINPHFFQLLLPGFTNHLDIPVAFSLKHLKGSDEVKTANLRSDASDITWKVKIDGRRISDGWEDFAVAHDLRIGDIVIFRHEGEIVFHVTALGPSCCEIQYGGYNVDEEEKIEKLRDTERVSRKKKRPEIETETEIETEAESSTTDQSCFNLTVTTSNLNRDTVFIPMTFGLVNGLEKKFKIVLMNEKGESWKIHLRRQAKPDGRFYMIGGWTSFCVANGKKHGDMFTFKLVRNEKTPLLQMKILKTLYIPKKFAVSNGLIENHQIDLMNEHGKSWTLYLRYEANRKRCNMSRGWRSFCVANGKKPGDIFNLKLVRNEERPVLKLLPMNLHKIEPSNDTRQDTEKSFLV